MKPIYLKARAKVNLTLNIVSKLENGYHNIESIFQKINLYDELYIEKNNLNDIEIKTNAEDLLREENIIYKTYKYMKNIFKEIEGVTVTLIKKIPMQAGLAGGSTDCASFILGINKLYNLNLTEEQITDIGKRMGGDVVPCFYNSALMAEGIGDIITKIKTNMKYYFVIIKPNFVCSTKEMYNMLDKKKDLSQLYNTIKIREALENNDLNEIANGFYNVFENAIENQEMLNKIKKELKENGALNSLLAGSGSCVFGIFQSKDKARTAYRNLSNKYQTYICTSYNSKRRDFI